MKEEYDLLVPEYFASFQCKMGACRHACCEGWPISISQDTYFRLMGMECSQDIRSRLDRGLHVKLRPTIEAYAQILPNYEGQCPLRMADGRCLMHAELGEDVLPPVCRLYPRGYRFDGDAECSCANSCEAVLETFLQTTEPLQFVHLKKRVEVPEYTPSAPSYETSERDIRFRLFLLSIMENRSIPLSVRIANIGDLFSIIDRVGADEKARTIDHLMENWKPYERELPQPTAEHMQKAFQLAEDLIRRFDERSESIRFYGQTAMDYFYSGEDERDTYFNAVEKLSEVLPTHEIFFEKMLVNHLYFIEFPLHEDAKFLCDDYMALCASYMFLRILELGCIHHDPTLTGIVDVAAAAFRLMEHTDFDGQVLHVLYEWHMTDPEILNDFLHL